MKCLNASQRGNRGRSMAKQRGGNDDGWGKVGMFIATRYETNDHGNAYAKRELKKDVDTRCLGQWNKERCEVCRHRVDDHMVCKIHPDWEISRGLVCDDFGKEKTK